MRERNRYLRGMTVWVGFTQTAITYQRDARYAGETKFSVRKMLRFSLDAIASFSHVPLQFGDDRRLSVLGRSRSSGIPFAIVAKFAGSSTFPASRPS